MPAVLSLLLTWPVVSVRSDYITTYTRDEEFSLA
jgi:hypothetical protein